MAGLVDEWIDAGLLGLSVNLLPWDKMGGDRYRSRPTPSVFARFAEYRALADGRPPPRRRVPGHPQPADPLEHRPAAGHEPTPAGSGAAHLAADPDGRAAGAWAPTGPWPPSANLYNDRLGAQRALPGAADTLRPLHRRHREPGDRGVRRRDRGAAPGGPGGPAPAHGGPGLPRPRSGGSGRSKVACPRLSPRPVRGPHRASCPDPSLDRPDLRRGRRRARGGPARHLPRPADRLRQRPALVHGGGQRPTRTTWSGSWPTRPP